MAKKYVLVDAQFHHCPLEVARKAAEIPTSDGLDFREKLERPGLAYKKIYDTEAAVRHMEECGVDMAVLMHPTWIRAGLEFCKMLNDSLAGLSKKYPGKFLPCAHTPYLEGQPAIDELDRAVNHLGLKAVTVLTSMRDVTLDDARLKPFFRKVRELRIPVVVHPTTKVPIWGGVKYNMSGSVSREYEVIKTFVEVLMGVLPEFPELNFLFAHYGGGVPFLMGRIMSWYDPENVRNPEKLVGVPPRTIKEFEESGLKDGFDELVRQVYFDTAGTGGWMPPLQQALLVIKPDRLCFATDYPHEMARPADLAAYIDGIQRLNIREEDKRAIFGGNLLRLFRA